MPETGHIDYRPRPTPPPPTEPANFGGPEVNQLSEQYQSWRAVTEQFLIQQQARAQDETGVVTYSKKKKRRKEPGPISETYEAAKFAALGIEKPKQAFKILRSLGVFKHELDLSEVLSLLRNENTQRLAQLKELFHFAIQHKEILSKLAQEVDWAWDWQSGLGQLDEIMARTRPLFNQVDLWEKLSDEENLRQVISFLKKAKYPFLYRLSTYTELALDPQAPGLYQRFCDQKSYDYSYDYESHLKFPLATAETTLLFKEHGDLDLLAEFSKLNVILSAKEINSLFYQELTPLREGRKTEFKDDRSLTRRTEEIFKNLEAQQVFWLANPERQAFLLKTSKIIGRPLYYSELNSLQECLYRVDNFFAMLTFCRLLNPDYNDYQFEHQGQGSFLELFNQPDLHLVLSNQEYQQFLLQITNAGQRNNLNPIDTLNVKGKWFDLFQDSQMFQAISRPEFQGLLDFFTAHHKSFQPAEIEALTRISKYPHALEVFFELIDHRSRLSGDILEDLEIQEEFIIFLCQHPDYLEVFKDPHFREVKNIFSDAFYAEGRYNSDGFYFIGPELSGFNKLGHNFLFYCQISQDPELYDLLKSKGTAERLAKLVSGKDRLIYQNIKELFTISEEAIDFWKELNNGFRSGEVNLSEIIHCYQERESILLGQQRLEELGSICEKDRHPIREIEELIYLGHLPNWEQQKEIIFKYFTSVRSPQGWSLVRLYTIVNVLKNPAQFEAGAEFFLQQKMIDPGQQQSKIDVVAAYAPYWEIIKEIIDECPDQPHIEDSLFSSWRSLKIANLKLIQQMPVDQRKKCLELAGRRKDGLSAITSGVVKFSRLLEFCSFSELRRLVDAAGSKDLYLPESKDLSKFNHPELSQAIAFVLAHIDKIGSDYIFSHLPSMIKIIQSGKLPLLVEALDSGSLFKGGAIDLSVIASFMAKDQQGIHWRAFLKLHAQYPEITLTQVNQEFNEFTFLISSSSVPLAMAEIRKLSPDYKFDNILSDVYQLDYAGNNLEALTLMLAAQPHFEISAIQNIQEIHEHYSSPEVQSFVQELSTIAGFKIKFSGELKCLSEIISDKESLLKDLRDIKEVFPDFVFVPDKRSHLNYPYEYLFNQYNLKQLLNSFNQKSNWRSTSSDSPYYRIWKKIQEKPAVDCFTSMDWDNYQALFKDTLAAPVLDKLKSKFPQAFSKTPEDKITPLFIFLAKEGGLKISPEGIADAASFVMEFGLQKTPKLYQYYQNILRHERGELDQFPEDQTETDLASLKARLDQTRRQLIAGKIPSPEQMSSLDYDILAAETMFYTSRWARAGKNLRSMHADFREAQGEEKIKPVPIGYEPARIKVAKVEKQYDLSACAEEYTRVRQDLLTAHEYYSDRDFSKIKNKVINQWSLALAEIDPTRAVNAFMAKNLEQKQKSYQAIVEQLRQIDSEDDLLELLYQAEVDLKIKKEFALTSPYIRQILYAKAMRTHSGFEALPIGLADSAELRLEYVQFLRDLSINIIKQHVLNVQDCHQYFGQGYILGKKKLAGSEAQAAQQRFNRFTKTVALNQVGLTLAKIESSLSGETEELMLVPDRSFVGELSGYYSEACFTRIDKMLETWPQVITAAMVSNPDEPAKQEIIGGVLFIESKTAAGETALIVRAINPRDEFLNTMQAASFCEETFRVATEYARRRGLKKVLVAGRAGTISNRDKIIKYVNSKYVIPEKAVPLESSLRFNGYELEDSCYLITDIDN